MSTRFVLPAMGFIGIFLTGCLESNPQPFPGAGDTNGYWAQEAAEPVLDDMVLPPSADAASGDFASGAQDLAGETQSLSDALEAIALDAAEDGELVPPGETDTGEILIPGVWTVGPDGAVPFEPGADNSDNVVLNGFGDLQLDSGEFQVESLWLPSSTNGTVTRLSTDSGKAVGQYHGCQGASIGGIDLAGNFWQCCLADGAVAGFAGGSVACADKNSNGTIDTSSDKNGDGLIDAGEMLAKGVDECIIGQIGGSAADCHGLACDPEGRIWGTGHSGQSSLRRFSADGSGVDLEWPTSFAGTALAFAPDGSAWVAVAEPPGLLQLDPAGNETFFPGTDPGLVPTDVALDAAGRIWFAAADGAGAGALGRFDPATEELIYVPQATPPKAIIGLPDGLVVASLPAEDALVGVFSDTPGVSAVSELPGCAPWALFTSKGTDLHVFCAEDSTFVTLDMPAGTVKSSLGVPPKPEATGAHWGDFHWQEYAATGTYRHVIEAPGGAAVAWTGLAVEGQIVGSGECTVNARIRWADTHEALGAAEWCEPGPVLLPGPGNWELGGLPAVGAFLELELILGSPGKQCTPTIHLVSLTWNQ